MATYAPDKPLIEVPELNVGDMKFEPANHSTARELNLLAELPADFETITFNVFNNQFIGILEVFFNGCGSWRFTEFKDRNDGKQVLIEYHSAMPFIQSKDTKELLQGVVRLTSGAHKQHDNIDPFSSAWREGRIKLEYIDTNELYKKIQLEHKNRAA